MEGRRKLGGGGGGGAGRQVRQVEGLRRGAGQVRRGGGGGGNGAPWGNVFQSCLVDAWASCRCPCHAVCSPCSLLLPPAVLFPPRAHEVAAEKLCSLAAERDDLQGLLLATLQRLEAVEGAVAAADASSAAMEDKV